MDTRSVAEWKQVFERLPSPEGTPVEQVVAQRVFGDLVGYRHRGPARNRDGEELANAMTAWAEMNAELMWGRRSMPGDEVPAQYRDGRDMAGNDV